MEVDEHKLARDTGRALQAESLMQNDIMQEAFGLLEAEYIKAWQSTRFDDQIGREKLFLAVNVIGKVKHHLQTVIADGKLAEAQVASLAKLRSR
jgi:hypothetical protein